MHRNHSNLYDCYTCPGCRRYSISPIGGVRLGVIGRHYILKGRAGARAVRMAGPKWEGGQTEGRNGGRADRKGENIFWW